MAEFLTTHSITYNLERIIRDARTNLFLLSPFLQLSNLLFERIKDASIRNVSIKIIFRENALKPIEREKLEHIKNLRLYNSHNLHAKCYFNETKMIIASLNLYEFSEKNNREMGVLISRTDDKELFTEAAVEALSIINSATYQPFQHPNYKKIDNRGPNIKKLYKESPGYCIRCRKEIDFNPMKPLCNECYRVWAQYGNPTFIESACHSCGEHDFITYNLPQCSICYDEYRHKMKI